MKNRQMNIGYIHLDYGEWTTGSYNIQEIGLAKALDYVNGHGLGTDGTPNNDCVLDVYQRQAMRYGSKHDR